MEDPTAMVMTQEWFQACPADSDDYPQITSLPIKFFTQYKNLAKAERKSKQLK